MTCGTCIKKIITALSFTPVPRLCKSIGSEDTVDQTRFFFSQTTVSFDTFSIHMTGNPKKIQN